jgi:hypothetical protein
MMAAEIEVPWQVSSLEWNPVPMSGKGSWSPGPTTSRHISRSRQPTTQRRLSGYAGMAGRCHRRTSDRVAEAQHRGEPGPNSRARRLGTEASQQHVTKPETEISERTSGEQLLHGEPHAGNLLNTKTGPLSMISRRVAAGLSSSTSHMCRKRSASATHR